MLRWTSQPHPSPAPAKKPLSRGRGRRETGQGVRGWVGGRVQIEAEKWGPPPHPPSCELQRPSAPCREARGAEVGRACVQPSPAPRAPTEPGGAPAPQASPQSSAQHLRWPWPWPPSPCPPWPQAPPDAHPGSWASAPGEESAEESRGQAPWRSPGEAGAAVGWEAGTLSMPGVLQPLALHTSKHPFSPN